MSNRDRDAGGEGVSDLDAALRNVTNVEDQQAIRDFAAFLEDPTSRCMICLSDDTDGSAWRQHKRLGWVFACSDCTGGWPDMAAALATHATGTTDGRVGA